MRIKRRVWIAGLACAALAAQALAVLPAAAAEWPQRPIRLIVPYTPGGGTDSVSRMIAEKLARQTGWNVVVENRPGAGGNIGMDLVARSSPDGYMIGMGQTSNLAINPALLPSMPFDAKKDFVPVALIASLPTVLVVKEDSPYHSLADIIKAAKAHPGAIKQAVASLGTVGHLAGEMLSYKVGIKVLQVPYKGAAPALTEILGGQTDYMFATPQSVMEMIRGKKLRALAVTSAKRLDIMPDTPTVAESGYEGFEAVDWKALMAPAGTPDDVLQTLHAAVEKTLDDKATLALLAAEGSTPLKGSVAEATQYIRAQQDSWAKLIKDAQIKLD